MVPLPVQTEFGIREIITLHDGCLGFATLQRTHGQRHLSVLVTNQRPPVNPTTGRECKHSAYTTAILEDDTIPVAVLRIHNRTLSYIAKGTELTLQDDVLLVRTVNIVCTVAYLSTMPSRTVGLRDHHQVVLPVMLDHTRALQESVLISLTLEDMLVGAFNDIREIGFQLHHLARAIDHIHPVVIVEEQGAVVEMAHS